MTNIDININSEVYKLCRATKNISLKNLEKYVMSLGYTVCYFNDNNGPGDEKINCLLEELPDKHAFTFCSVYEHCIFIDVKFTVHDKTRLLLHEIGHIVLGHIGNTINTNNIDNIAAENEAEVFAYAVLHYKNRNHALPIILSIIGVFIVFLMFVYALKYKEAQIVGEFYSTDDNAVILDIDTNDQQIEYYITPQGDKYHVAGCRYVTDRAIKITDTNVLLRFEPCKYCCK